MAMQHSSMACTFRSSVSPILVQFCLLSNVIVVADRTDYGRDIANFVIYHLPEARDALGKDLPFQLPRLSNTTTTSRVKNGFSDRHVITMGHSLGGDAT